MKTFRIVTALILCFCLLFSVSSCSVLVLHGNGHHKGWYKDIHNPHHSYKINPRHNEKHNGWDYKQKGSDHHYYSGKEKSKGNKKK